MPRQESSLSIPLWLSWRSLRSSSMPSCPVRVIRERRAIVPPVDISPVATPDAQFGHWVRQDRRLWRHNVCSPGQTQQISVTSPIPGEEIWLPASATSRQRSQNDGSRTAGPWRRRLYGSPVREWEECSRRGCTANDGGSIRVDQPYRRRLQRIERDAGALHLHVSAGLRPPRTRARLRCTPRERRSRARTL